MTVGYCNKIKNRSRSDSFKTVLKQQLQLIADCPMKSTTWKEKKYDILLNFERYRNENRKRKQKNECNAVIENSE